MRAPPSSPPAADWTATGLSANGWSFIRQDAPHSARTRQQVRRRQDCQWIRRMLKRARARSALAAVTLDEFRERRELLLDEIAGRLVFQLARLLIHPRGRVADEDLRL